MFNPKDSTQSWRELGAQVIDASDDFGVIDEVLQEATPCFGGHACKCENLADFFDAIVGQRCDVFVRSGVNADDIAVGKIVVVADDGFKHFGVLSQQAGDMGDGADICYHRHHAASLCHWALGVQFQGSSSS